MAGRRAVGRGEATIPCIRWQPSIVAVLTGVLTCFVVFGEYDLVSSESALPTATHALRSSVDKYLDSDSKVQLSLLLTPGDRVIISSLDQKARFHEVVICQRTSENPVNDDHSGTHSSGVDFAIVPPSRREMILPHQNDFNTLIYPEMRTIAADDCPSTVELTQVVDGSRSERPFRLPRFFAGRMESMPSVDYSDHIVVCQERAVTDSVRLYTAEQTLSPRIMDCFLATLEDIIIPAVMDHVGPIADIDSDNHLSVVVCELSDCLTDGEPPLWGCVRAADFLSAGPFCGDIIYLDARLLHSDALPAVVLHELTHAAVFSLQRRLQCEGRQVHRLSGWMNEAIAHSCEYRVFPTSPNLSDRISAYLRQPGSWPLMLPSSSAGTVSSRGPMRAAGMFYVDFLRQTATVPELIEREVLRAGSHQKKNAETFSESFREWTVWMSDRQQSGEIFLKIGELSAAAGTNKFAIRGTAATWWQSKHAGEFTIQASHDSALQVTVIGETQTSSGWRTIHKLNTAAEQQKTVSSFF
ncbi:MAG: hypothetical protein MK102_13405 [Fuerstiella sp.]|nr:hypothetical protein [Fuerstiella sp.]